MVKTENLFKKKLEILKRTLKEESPDLALLLLSFHNGSLSEKEVQKRLVLKLNSILKRSLLLVSEEKRVIIKNKGHLK